VILDGIPSDPEAIAAVARQLTIHHNLLPYFGISRGGWDDLARVWPPRERDPYSAAV
jgi:hypothetical protein